MSPDTLLALLAFSLVSSITPGPNNLMLMTSGVNFGLRRTLPHMMGVGIGFTLMVALVGVGVMQVFALWPPLETALRVACLVYVIWLAWKIAHAAPASDQGATRARPFRFAEAMLFQWVNPKAWAMALTAITAYAPDRALWAVVVVALVFGAVNLPSISLWVLLGSRMRDWLTVGARLRVFNWTMAVLLVGSVVPML